jgi:hypothetical protein
MVYSTLFESLHIALLAVPLKFLHINLKLNILTFPILFISLGCIFNYLFFIRGKRLKRIIRHFEGENMSSIRQNVIFFGYLILLFILLFIESSIYTKCMLAK